MKRLLINGLWSLVLLATASCGMGICANCMDIPLVYTSLSLDISHGGVNGLTTKVAGNQCFRVSIGRQGDTSAELSAHVTSSRAHTLFYKNRCPNYNIAGTLSNDTSYSGTTGITLVMPSGSTNLDFYVKVGNTSDAEEDTVFYVDAPGMERVEGSIRVMKVKTSIIDGGDDCAGPSTMRLVNAADGTPVTFNQIPLYIQLRNAQWFTAIFTSQANCLNSTSYINSYGGHFSMGFYGQTTGLGIALDKTGYANLPATTSQLTFYYNIDNSWGGGPQTITSSERFYRTIDSFTETIP